PDRPDDLEEGIMMGDWSGGTLFIGTKGKLVAGLFGDNPILFPKSLKENYQNPPQSLPRIKNGVDGHWMDWVRACKESPENRVPASSNFEYSGPLTESVVMGNLAIRLQDLKKKLLWDGQNMRITNISDSDKVRVVTSDKFTVIDGHPHFDTQRIEIPAKVSSEEWIKHTYREGWSL
ncbi:MAG: gfo/Idh/MocA family oxidoreductase, partial [Bacteroidales bacterium]|nr:gfo/Idh/MocA family oxidoreductase [Bacteroidales bacterium]